MKKAIIILMLLFLAGCAGVRVQEYYKDVKFVPAIPSNIIVFADKPKDKTFFEIGEITVTGANNWTQIEAIFRSKAAEMGGDAVYVFSKKEETKQYISADDCYVRHGYYYPYHHFGWHRYRPHYYYPRGYYYCYGYQSAIQTATFISAVGIVIKYGSWPAVK